MKRIIVVLLLIVPLMSVAQNVDKLRAKADGGDTKAMMELAMWYECGHGVTVDSAKALSWYQRAADKGDADAKAHLARYYLHYTGLHFDTVKSIQLLKESMAAGSGLGMSRMAWCYAHGIGVERNVEKSKELYDKAMAKGVTHAFNIVGENYFWGDDGYDHDVEKAAQIFMKMKDDMMAGDKYSLLAHYYRLRGDYKKSWQWLNKGIAMDNFKAQLFSALYTFEGAGVEANTQKSIDQFEALLKKYPGNEGVVHSYLYILQRAETPYNDTAKMYKLAMQAESACYDLLADSYQYGVFTEVDSVKMLKYRYKAVADKDGSEMVKLAAWHYHHDNLDSMNYYLDMAYDLFSEDAANVRAALAEEDENLSLAAKYYEQAGNWGDEESRVTAGRIYASFGEMDKAMAFFDKAIANYEPSAWYWKAYLQSYLDQDYHKTLETGIKKGCTTCAVSLGDEQCDGDKPNYKKAATYYQQGGAEGMVREALLYMRGQLGNEEPEDYRTALNLFLKAARQGYADGMYHAGYCYQVEVAGAEKRDSMYYWYKELADIGDGRGMLGVGTCYEAGIGVEADTLKALEWYERAGEAGISNGYAYCADFYVYGMGVPKDEAKAFEYDQKAVACSDDNAKSLLRLAECYLVGIGTPIDTMAAMPLIIESAQKGSYKANALVGDALYYGWPGVEQNTDSAMYYYYQASKGDDPRGDYMIGQLLMEQEMYGPAIQYYRSAASNGSVDAYERLAECVYHGYGMEADPVQAYSMFTKAAEDYDNAASFMMLGVMHYSGNGCQRDTVKAFQYTLKAAQMGNIPAMRNTYIFMGNGIGVEADTVEAVRWLQRAADLGDVRSMMGLAEAYTDGEWVEASMEQAVKWYQRAAENGSTEALWRLGLCYEEGEGVILNHRKAFEYYQRAAEAGSPTGMYLVGHCYEDAIFVEASTTEANNWYLQAAENGHLTSCYLMGVKYANGDGVKKNKKEARRLLTIAAENGVEAAAKALKEL